MFNILILSLLLTSTLAWEVPILAKLECQTKGLCHTPEGSCEPCPTTLAPTAAPTMAPTAAPTKPPCPTCPVCDEKCDEPIDVKCESGILKVQLCEHHIKYDLERLDGKDASLDFMFKGYNASIVCDNKKELYDDFFIEKVECDEDKLKADLHFPVHLHNKTGIELVHMINGVDKVVLTL
jgi:hypothetical protein